MPFLYIYCRHFEKKLKKDYRIKPDNDNSEYHSCINPDNDNSKYHSCTKPDNYNLYVISIPDTTMIAQQTQPEI